MTSKPRPGYSVDWAKVWLGVLTSVGLELVALSVAVDCISLFPVQNATTDSVFHSCCGFVPAHTRQAKPTVIASLTPWMQQTSIRYVRRAPRRAEKCNE